MLQKKINILKSYRQLLLECKKIQVINQIDSEVENMFPTILKTPQKVLTRYKYTKKKSN